MISEAVLRDGKPYPPSSLDELRIASDAPRSLRDLRNGGFLLVVVSNQPDVARGAQQRMIVERMNQALLASLPLHDLLVCYHSDDDRCTCRKPKPGLLFEAAERHAIDLGNSFLIGDRWRDVDAGHNAGCRPVWIDRGYDERKPARAPAARVASLRAAADWILKFAPR